MARLIYIPVLHGSAEMGSAAAAYRAAFVAKFGECKWQERSTEFDAIWRAIADAIEALGLDFSRVKLFQDSLPVCGHEIALTHVLAAQGSRNHQLLEKLAERGAVLVGTESPALLLAEYQLLGSDHRNEEQAAKLLEQRDRFVAARIDEELKDDDTGLLFMGALHHVPKYLAKRIRVENLVVHGL